MSGKIVGLSIVLIALVAGAALYYLQIYAFYRDVADDGAAVVLATESGDALSVPYTEFEAIDADSSPIRYRACFKTDFDVAGAEGLVFLSHKEPRNAPGWFSCFDAEALATEIDAGTAQVVLSVKNVAYGVDRVIAFTKDGRGFAWHELNGCGEKAYDGTVVGEACPDRTEESQ